MSIRRTLRKPSARPVKAPRRHVHDAELWREKPIEKAWQCTLFIKRLARCCHVEKQTLGFFDVENGIGIKPEVLSSARYQMALAASARSRSMRRGTTEARGLSWYSKNEK